MSKKDPPEAKPFTIDNPVIMSVPHGNMSFPALSYDGPAPTEGEGLIVTIADGTAYEGVASEVLEAGGNVLVHVRGGLRPV